MFSTGEPLPLLWGECRSFTAATPGAWTSCASVLFETRPEREAEEDTAKKCRMLLLQDEHSEQLCGVYALCSMLTGRTTVPLLWNEYMYAHGISAACIVGFWPLQSLCWCRLSECGRPVAGLAAAQSSDESNACIEPDGLAEYSCILQPYGSRESYYVSKSVLSVAMVSSDDRFAHDM